MNRHGLLLMALLLSVPRASGDEPFTHSGKLKNVRCSPRERG